MNLLELRNKINTMIEDDGLGSHDVKVETKDGNTIFLQDIVYSIDEHGDEIVKLKTIKWQY